MAPSRAIDRFDRFWRRHGRTFWVLHSVWALLTGALILWLAHERYDFIYWVVGFLGLTWLSTLYFGRPQSAPAPDEQPAARFRRGFASYLTRVLYQETLCFLIPFYAYSAVFPSWNVAFLGLLAVLAVLACLDLVFDRWLRSSAAFSLVFFASVTFAALNLLLPMLFSVDPALATPLSAVAALLIAAPLVLQQRQGGGGWRSRLGLGAAALAILAVGFGLPQLVPPAPLRLQTLSFAADLEREQLEPIGIFRDAVDAASLDGELVVLARVFAPARVPARVSLAWYRNDELVRSSREVEILAHDGGFRFWDVLRASGPGFEPGLYRVVLQTAQGRAFGSSQLLIR